MFKKRHSYPTIGNIVDMGPFTDDVVLLRWGKEMGLKTVKHRAKPADRVGGGRVRIW